MVVLVGPGPVIFWFAFFLKKSKLGLLGQRFTQRMFSKLKLKRHRSKSAKVWKDSIGGCIMLFVAVLIGTIVGLSLVFPWLSEPFKSLASGGLSLIGTVH